MSKQSYLLEVCCGGYSDVLASYKGGAERVELCSALSVGGLTPSFGAFELARKLDIGIACMVRPRGAGFKYTADEMDVIEADARYFLEHGADAIVFGFLNDDFTMNRERCEKLTNLAHKYQKEAVVHRAFDCVSNPFKTMEELIELGVDRILTSGQKPNAFEGIELLQELQKKYGEQIEVLAGCGVTLANASEILEKTGVTQLHSSCKTYHVDPTTSNGVISYDYIGEGKHEGVDEAVVKQMKELL